MPMKKKSKETYYKPVNNEFDNLMHEIVSASNECFGPTNRQKKQRAIGNRKHNMLLYCSF
jgi:hypothetical protein